MATSSMPRPTIKRLGNADGNAVEIGADLVVHAQDRFVGLGAHKEARRYQHAVVKGVAVDVLDTVDRLDDGFERLGHKPRRILGLEPIGADLDVHHRHGNLRLLLARQHDKRDAAQGQGGKQEKRRQLGSDERPGEVSGNAQFRG